MLALRCVLGGNLCVFGRRHIADRPTLLLNLHNNGVAEVLIYCGEHRILRFAVTLATSNLITHAHLHMSRLAATRVRQPQTGLAISRSKMPSPTTQIAEHIRGGLGDDHGNVDIDEERELYAKRPPTMMNLISETNLFSITIAATFRLPKLFNKWAPPSPHALNFCYNNCLQ